jgi:hypothetical protein
MPARRYQYEIAAPAFKVSAFILEKTNIDNQKAL